MDKLEIATEIVKKLSAAGHIAYFAGGWVRDYLMGHPSSDIDIATDASPEKIASLFTITIPVGVAFGVIIVIFEGEQFEIATFRKDVGVADGRRPIDIKPSSPVEDALRRDFTINGMFYDPINKNVLDYIHGKVDIEKRLIRSIGNPHERFFEDRLRMLRAVRFSARLGFHIAEDTEQAIREHADRLLPSVSIERIWQEFKKMAEDGHMDQALIDMHRLGLLRVIFPELEHLHLNDLKGYVRNFSLFPKMTSPILYLLQLFPKKERSQVEFLCRYLKVSNKEIALALSFLEAKELVAQTCSEDYDWAIFYAKPESQLLLHLLSLDLNSVEREKFLLQHQQRESYLHPHIERIRKKKPLVTSEQLKQIGVAPGKDMGLLLKKAERISINQNIQDPLQVLSILNQKQKTND